MDMSQETAYFLIGALVGLCGSGIGALVDYFIAKRQSNKKERVLPGCIFLVTGSLGLIGLLFTTVAFLLTGGVRLALLSGLGVLGGFTVTFMLLTLGWLLFVDRSPSSDYFEKESPQEPKLE